MPTFSIINRFLEDTCVIATLAYLISRGPLLPKLFSGKRRVRDIVALAIVFGLAGGSELIFPGERYPYIIFTMSASFAAYAGGLGLGLMASAVMILLATVGLLTGHDRFSVCLYLLSLLAANLAGASAAKLLLLADGRFQQPTYREVFRPLSDHLQKVKAEFPDRRIAVIIPELVETNWIDWILHSHRATALKAQLLFLADDRIVVINMPWYLNLPRK